MSRVAIIGSCITRDVWRVGNVGADDLLYIARTSLPSLFSTPVLGFEPPDEAPAGLGRTPHRLLTWDLKKKALAALTAHRPTHVIFDFIDERYDLMRVGGALVTESWELRASGYLDHPSLAGARRIDRLSEGCTRIWREGVREMADFLWGGALRDAAIVLHEARWAEAQTDGTGARSPLTGVEILPGRPADIARHNALLEDYELELLRATPYVAKVAAPQLRLADADHQWGLSPFHYIREYYEEIWRQLQAHGV